MSEMLSLNDLDEVERWLRGELSPAVRGQRNPGGVLGRGLRTLFVRLLGAERRHYEVRSKTFRAAMRRAARSGPDSAHRPAVT